MPNKARVFCLAPTQHGEGNARLFGEVVYLYDRRPPNRMPPVFAANFSQDTLDALDSQGYDPDVDYLLMNGSQVALIQWASAVVSEWGFCNALMFDASAQRYIARVLGFQTERKDNGSERSRLTEVHG